MASECIPANADITGIGVRTATYAQNVLCFAPIVSHLWDGKVSGDEIAGVKDQSIGMLAVAFAILVSAMVEAKGHGPGQSLTSFHAAIVLDLSWMNNTSTFIWFLLYAHQRSKNDTKGKVIPATWAGWYKHLSSPLRRLIWGDSEQVSNRPRRATTTRTAIRATSKAAIARAIEMVTRRKMLHPKGLARRICRSFNDFGSLFQGHSFSQSALFTSQ